MNLKSREISFRAENVAVKPRPKQAINMVASDTMWLFYVKLPS